MTLLYKYTDTKMNQEVWIICSNIWCMSMSLCPLFVSFSLSLLRLSLSYYISPNMHLIAYTEITASRTVLLTAI